MGQDLLIMSRYPFTRDAREWVRSRGIKVDDMLSADMGHVHNLAEKRVTDSIEGAEVEGSDPGRIGDSESALLSYPVARLMVAMVGDSKLAKWFSHHEGARASHFMEREKEEMLLEIGEYFSLPATEEPPGGPPEGERPRMVNKGVRPGGDRMRSVRRDYWVDFVGFLKGTAHITGKSWDLANQRLVDGYVGLNRSRYIRVLQEYVREKVEEGLLSEVNIKPPAHFAERIKRIKGRVNERKKSYQPTDLGEMSITRLPPCMRQMLGMAQAGENMPHHGRFAMVTFLNAIGMDNEEIFNVFTSSPDFKESIVRYQIEHITGVSSATEYSVPGCETMKTGGVCYNPDSLCGKEWMTHPLTYYKVKGKKKRSTSGENAS